MTKVAIATLYRLLAAQRFRRVCFVVDRNAPRNSGNRRIFNNSNSKPQDLADIFGLEGLKTVKPDLETKVHICTIQGLVNRVLFTEDTSETPPVDQYDLMVVDECHRGYLLDRELSAAELSFRIHLEISPCARTLRRREDRAHGNASPLALAFSAIRFRVPPRLM
jgi:type I restriction enzyme, R subunit